MNALLVFLAQLLASLGAPIVLTVETSVPSTPVVAPTPPPPPPDWVIIDRDPSQISNGF